MNTAAQVLGKFAAELRYSDIPHAVAERAKECIIDAIGAATFGSQLPWGKMVADYARRYGAGGPCSVIGFPELRVHAPYAAMANGVLVHAFELDGGRDPSVGVHPGPTLLPPLLAAVEECKADGKTAVAAFVAGCEVMFRIGLASHHHPERIGFHQPGLTGTYGAAAAAGRAFGLNAEQLANALGIAGSLSSGLLAFTKSESGAMVKRLHLGRAAESGILAARLAADGYTGPETVLEGKFGYLDAYCRDEGEPGLLTAGLHDDWETLRISIKRYPCHMNAHTPVQALRDLMSQHRFTAVDVEQIVVEGDKKLLSHHNIAEPGDIAKAQYSVPFCMAVALVLDPEDPKSFSEGVLKNSAILAACRRVELRVLQGPCRSPKSTRVTVHLKNGSEFVRAGESFKGMPDDPLNRQELRRKFGLMTASLGDDAATRLFESLEHMEDAPQFTLASVQSA